MDNKLKILVLSALFHDFGKFLQRNKDFISENHSYLSEIFVNFFNPGEERVKKFLGKDLLTFKDFSDFNSVKKIISLHHERQDEIIEKELSQEQKEILEILKKADNLAAATQRDIFKHESKPSYEVNQKDIFPYIFSDEKNQLPDYFHRISALYEIERLIPQAEGDLNPNRNKIDYGKLIDNENLGFFLKNILNLEQVDFLTFLYHIDDLFEIFLTHIPEDRRDIYQLNSLYDHIKLTAAFAFIYYYGEKFHFLSFDIAGIQKFIFNIKSKKAGKILRGRSLFIQVLQDSITFDLIKQNNLIPQLVINNWGGNVSLLLPEKPQIFDNVETFFSTINKKILVDFGLQIRINNFKQAIPFNKKSIIEATSGQNNKLYEKKIDEKIFFQIDELNNGLKPQEVDDSSLCDFCDNPCDPKLTKKDDFNNEEIKSCPQCHLFLELSQKILSKKPFAYDFNNKKILDIENEKNIDSQYLFLKPFLNLKGQMDTGGKYFSSFPSKTIYYSVVNPKKSFSDIAKESTGAKVLAYLKGDVDNMSLIISQGLKFREDENNERGYRLTDYLHFARRINFFFQNYLSYLICDDQRFKEKIYIVFSGGDDFFLIGPWSNILEFVIYLNDQFKKFTCYNPQLTISLGATLAKPDDPIFLISEKVEEELKNAKKTKNSFSFLYSSLPVDNWQKIKDWAFNLASSYISTSFFYKVFKIADYLERPDNENYQKAVALQKIAYFYYRLIDAFDDEEKEKNKFFIDIFNKILTIPRESLVGDDQLFLENLKTIINLVLLYRRGGEENE